MLYKFVGVIVWQVLCFITELIVAGKALVVPYIILICIEKCAEYFVCISSISGGYYSENIRVGITLETIRCVGGAHII